MLSAHRKTLAPDLPGYGRSSIIAAPYDPPYFAKFVIDFLERLELIGIDVVGNSLGGLISLLAASSGRISFARSCLSIRRPAQAGPSHRLTTRCSRSWSFGYHCLDRERSFELGMPPVSLTRVTLMKNQSRKSSRALRIPRHCRSAVERSTRCFTFPDIWIAFTHGWQASSLRP